MTSSARADAVCGVGQLRPELVQSYDVALSADALSGWGAVQGDALDGRVLHALRDLESRRLRAFAADMDACGDRVLDEYDGACGAAVCFGYG